MAVDINSKISSWISSSFLGHLSVDTEILGSSEIGDGYTGDIVFAKVKCRKRDGSVEVHDLALKYGKMSEALRQKLPVEMAFKREIFIYDTVVPLFRGLEEKRNLKILDNFLVKCFKTLQAQNEEVLVFQNAKAIGYELHDRFQILNLNHLKLAFENYGRWHAFSIAYRDQYPEEFRKKFSDMESVIGALAPTIKYTIQSAEKMILLALDNQEDLDLKKQVKRVLKGGMYESIVEFQGRQERNCVISHGDCWNNNFMYKYLDDDKENPQAVVFLDFQLSNTTSPVFDLSYHLYSTASMAEFRQLDTLLRIYHSSLSSTIRQLGSDPEKLFPYEELIRQWKEYSLYGCLLSSLVLPIALSEKGDEFDMQNMSDQNINNLFDQLKKKNLSRITSRLRDIMKHFCENL